MISQTIAQRYAQALMFLGRDDGRFADYGRELADVAALTAETGLVAALTSPLFPGEIRRRVLDEVLSRLNLSGIMANFILLLQEKGRLAHLPAINDCYRRLVDEANKIKRAAVVTAVPIDPSLREKIKAVLEKLTGYDIVLETREDPEIIGGLVAQVGDLTLDGSVRTQLRNLKESLIKR